MTRSKSDTCLLAVAEGDARFEVEALAAWKEFQLSGELVDSETLDAIFTDALSRAKSVSKRQG